MTHQSNQPRSIGILGGMGPLASAELYLRIVQECQLRYHAVQDSDFPEIFVRSLTLQGFDETGIRDAELVREQLRTGIAELSPIVDFIVIPCNTVHYFLYDMQSASTAPILSLVQATAERVARDKHKVVGLLSSASTRDLGLYQQACAVHGIKIVTVSDEQQHCIDSIIEHVMGGTQTRHDDELLMQIGYDLVDRGATGVIVGCTELPFAMTRMQEIQAYDTLKILTQAAVDFAYEPRDFSHIAK